jgi:hypothetical protein
MNQVNTRWEEALYDEAMECAVKYFGGNLSQLVRVAISRLVRDPNGGLPHTQSKTVLPKPKYHEFRGVESLPTSSGRQQES